MKKIVAIIGARPQFIKHAPLEIELSKKFEVVTIHTGQHFDESMSQVFFDELGMKAPNYLLSLGGGTHGEMTGKMLIEMEPILVKESPEWVLVYGDTNSTLAGALLASKLDIRIIHVEAGLRSFNRSMPEEINRVVTDHLASILLAPSDAAIQHLADEGIKSGIYKTGDVMLDALKLIEHAVTEPNQEKEYILMTLHRPYNVDDFDRLHRILRSVAALKQRIIFPLHPRTLAVLKERQMLNAYDNISFIEPIGYIQNMSYLTHASGLITDSGGMQKEAYFLKKKCMTIRSETEWVETLSSGWNTLVFSNDELAQVEEVWSKTPGEYDASLYGDGRASAEISNIIEQYK